VNRKSGAVNNSPKTRSGEKRDTKISRLSRENWKYKNKLSAASELTYTSTFGAMTVIERT
jgi:hypothetical protein